MLKAYAAQYVRLARLFDELHAVMKLISADAGLDSNVGDHPQSQRLLRLQREMGECGALLPLPVFRAHLTKFDAACGDRREQDILAIWGSLPGILETELESHLFLWVKPELAQFFGARFSETIDAKFPKTISDTENAGKCLAIGQGTACVFHLMRAMESAIQALCERLGISNTNREWGKLLSDLHKKIEEMDKGAARNAWSESHAHLYHVKQAWRNDTMHPNEKYTDDEALEVYRAVKAFMSHLATLI
jgi:HEPN domain-containing protein